MCGSTLCFVVALVSRAGIVVYKEVTGVGKIACFLGSGCVVVAGAVLLGSYGSCTTHHSK